jgi:hypothetical protein
MWRFRLGRTRSVPEPPTEPVALGPEPRLDTPQGVFQRGTRTRVFEALRLHRPTQLRERERVEVPVTRRAAAVVAFGPEGECRKNQVARGATGRRPTDFVAFATVPQFYFRPAHNEAQLIRDCAPNAFDAAIVPAPYLAPHPEEEAGDPWTLAAALNARGVPWVVDLVTPQLVHDEVVRADSCRRLRETNYAQVVRPLPLDIARLENEEARNAFVDAAVAFQLGVPMLAAPYFEIDLDDLTCVDVNIAMLRRVVGAASDRLAVGFVQMTLRALNSGVAARVARRYADTGVTRVFLRVRNLRFESATVAQLANYLAAIDDFRSANVGVICDPAGRYGDAAVTAGAAGCSAGSHFFRSVPRRVVAASGGGGGTKLAVELPRYEVVTRDALTGAIDCPVPGCAAAAGDDSPAALKEHNLHYLRYLTTHAIDAGAVIRALHASGQPSARAWAEALERQQRESA